MTSRTRISAGVATVWLAILMCACDGDGARNVPDAPTTADTTSTFGDAAVDDGCTIVAACLGPACKRRRKGA
jgi:hypothetical protein